MSNEYDQQFRSCPEAEVLVAWAEGVDGFSTAHVPDHIQSCPACSAAVDLLADPVPPPVAAGPLAERYQLDRVLDHGGFGVVCTARDALLRRRVAVKLIDRSEWGAERLIEEAVNQAAFSHPNVAPVLDAGIDGDHVYIVLELVEGVDAFTASLAPGFSVEDARRIVIDAARGLSALHRSGLTHGDVTPRNIIVGHDGRARLIDFGMASQDLRARGGTRGFQAPETDVGVATPHSDQFGLGRTLLDLLHRAEGSAPELNRAARRACARAPEQRFPTLDAFLAETSRPVTSQRARVQPWVAAVFALMMTPEAIPDRHADRLDAIEEATHWALASGDSGRARSLWQEAEAIASRSGSTDLEVRAALIAARVLGVLEPERAHEHRVRAARLAERADDAELRAEALARLAAGIEGDNQTQALLLQLAAGAAEGSGTDSAARRFVAKIEILHAAFNPAAPLPAAEGELAPFVAVSRAYRNLNDTSTSEAERSASEETELAGEPAKAAAATCRELEGDVPRGLCLSILAASAGVGTPASLSLANDALATLEPALGEDHCDLQLALFLRGSARLDHDNEAAERDLSRAQSMCPDDPPGENLPVRLQWARAALRVGRSELARTIAAEVDPSHQDPDVRELRGLLDRELAALALD